MRLNFILVLVNLFIYLAIVVAIVYLFILIVKALKKYIQAEKKATNKRSLGEVLKQHRTECKMTQEFVAESLGVSRQAVSKWESGASDPSTTNLKAVAKLYGVHAEDLLKEIE